MTHFTFDLQRFTDYDVGDADALKDAIGKLATGDTINFIKDITGNDFIIPANVTGVTIDFGNNSYIFNGNNTITISQGAEVTFKNGSINTYSKANYRASISNAGKLTLVGMSLTYSGSSGSLTLTNTGTLNFNGTEKANNVTQKNLTFTNDGENAEINITGSNELANANGNTGLTLNNTNKGTINITGTDENNTNKIKTISNADGATVNINEYANTTGLTNTGTCKVFSHFTLTDASVSSLTTGNGVITAPTTDTITLQDEADVKYEATATNFVFEKNDDGTYSEDLRIKLSSGTKFTVTYPANYEDSGTTSATTVDYSVDLDNATGKNNITAKLGSQTIGKMWTGGDIADDSNWKFSDLYYLSSNFKDTYSEVAFDKTNDTYTLTIKTDASLKSSSEPYLIIESESKNRFGLLTYKDGTFSLAEGKTPGDRTENVALSSIIIESGFPVTISNYFAKDTPVPVTVKNTTTNTEVATFTSTDTTNDTFTVNYDSTNNKVTVETSEAITLTNGTLYTSTAGQTITAGTYGVASVNNSEISVNVNSSSGTTTYTVGSIDKEDSFKVGDVTYIMKAAGLVVADTNDTNKIAQLYDGTTAIDTSVDLSTLSKSMKAVVAPDNGTLTLGTMDAGNALVVNSTDISAASITKLADLVVSGTDTQTYKLSEIDTTATTAFKSAVTTIELTGGDTTIAKDLVDTTTTITANRAEFNVTTATADFTVSNVTGDNKATISNAATAVTLLDGTIAATENQVVTLDGTGTTFTPTSGDMNVTVDKTASTATIVASASDKFSINSNAYEITSSSSSDITFTVDSNGAVTIENLGTGDEFKLGTDTYTVKGAGFIKTDSSGKVVSLWTSEGKHTLTGGSVTVANLTNAKNWQSIITVNANAATEIKSDLADGKYILISDDYSTIYGELERKDTTYTISKPNDAEGKLKTLIFAPTSGTLAMGKDFTGVEIVQSSIATLTVTAAESTGYNVTFGDSQASLTNATAATLTSGTLAADSNVTVTVNVSGTDKTVKAAKDTNITIKAENSDATISGLAKGESFTVDDSTTYTMLILENDTVKRLHRDDGKLWGGDAVTDSVKLSDLAKDTWNTLIAGAAALDITDAIIGGVTEDGSAFIVDDTSLPEHIYATLTKASDSYTLSKTNQTADLTSITVTATKPVTFSVKDFANTSIKAGTVATFKSTDDSKDFTVKYGSTTASVTGSTALTLENGTLTLSETTQTVTANGQTVKPTAGSVTLTYDGTTVTTDISTLNAGATVNSETYTLTKGDGIKVVISGNKTTIGEISVGDQFTINDGTTTYTFDKTDLGFVRTNTNGTYSIWSNTKEKEGEVTVDRLIGDGANDWNTVIACTNGELTINDSSVAGVLVDDPTNPTIIYGELTSKNSAYTLTQNLADGANTPLTLITVNGVTANIADEFNAVPIRAYNSATVKNSNYLLFQPTKGDAFTFNKLNYVMQGAGLTYVTNKANYIWSTETDTTFTLPADNWLKYFSTGSDLKIDLSKAKPDTGENIITNSDVSKRLATMYYSDGSYEFTSTNSDNIASIQLGNGTLTATTGFETKIITGKGTYTVNDKEYVCSAALTIDATAETSTLYTGTVTIDENKAVTVDDEELTVTSGSITATASEGAWANIASLSDGDTFTLDGNTYKMFGTKTLAMLDENGNLSQIYKSAITSGKITYSALTTETNFVDIVQLDENGLLNLTNELESAVVVAHGDPSVKIADLSYTNAGVYSIKKRSDGDLTSFKGAAINKSVPDVSTDIETNVYTTDAVTFGVNGKEFVAQNELTIATVSKNAYLTNGSVTLAQDGTVTTRRTDGTVEAIKAVTGSLVVTASGDDITISNLVPGNEFTVDKNSYTVTSIGVTLSDKTKLVPDVGGSVTTAALANALTIMAIDGTLTVDSSTPANLALVDMTDLNNAFYYGSLTKDGDTYKLDTVTTPLTKITVTGVKLTLPKEEANVPITAGNATFTVEASGDFTVNATSTPIITDADKVNLTAGTIQATVDLPIGTGDYTFTATNGDMTITAGTVTIGKLNQGDTFTLNGTNYAMTATGLYDTDNQQLVTKGVSSDLMTFTPGDAAFANTIAPKDGVLDLTTQTVDAVVVDNVTNPTTKLGNLTVKDSTYTLDFAIKAKVPSGTVTVNSVAYDATTPLTLDVTATTSTLNTGTVNVNGSVTATDDSITGTGITATATDGKFTELGSLETGDQFTYAGKTYTQTPLGLMTGTTLAENLNGSTLELSQLDSAKWSNLVALTDGALNLADVTADSIVVDSVTNPTTKLGTATVDGTSYTVDFATKANAPIGTTTVNGVTYDATTPLILDVTADGSTLNTGTVNVTGSATATNDSISGTGFTATAQDGKFTAIDGLAVGNSFSYGGTTYTQTALGLMNGSTIATDLNSGFELSKLDSADWQNFIVPVDGVIDLTDAKSALVLDDLTAPTTKLGNLTVDGTNYTLDFPIKVTTPSGLVTVNGITYDATTPLTLDVTADGSTLNTGSVKVNGTVTATDDSITGKEFIATAQDGKFTALAELGVGDTFTHAGKSYTKTALGLMTGSTIRTDLTAASLNLSQLDSGKSFNLITLTDGMLDLADVTADSLVVDSVTNPTTKIGTVTVGDGFTIDFATKTKSTGTTKVNGITFDATGELTLDVTPTSATLNTGSVNVNGTVNATDDSVTGNGLVATAQDGKFTTLSGITAGSEFTLGGTTYKFIDGVGLYTDGALITGGFTDGTLTVADIAQTQAIAPTNGTINLANATSAIVLNDLTNPTTKLGNLTVDGSNYTLDFPIKVTAGAGQFTVNGTTYNATSNVTLDVTATGSTLNTGSITVDGVANATNDSIMGSGFTVTAQDGTFTKISGLDVGETFIYGGATYTQTPLGLMNEDAIRTDLNSSFDLSQLDSGSALNLITLTDGTLNLANITADSLVVDNTDYPTTKLGTVKVADNGYTVDFAAQIVANGKTTVNGVTFDSEEELLVDSTATSATLNTGSVYVEGTVSATNDSITASGIYATALDGKFTALELDDGATFTYGGKNYQLVENVGLYNSTDSALVTEGLEENNLTIADMKQTKVIAPTNGTINLANQTSAIVLDSVTDPTSKLGNLTVNGSNYTLDFAIKATVPRGTTTVNGAEYDATTALTLDVTANDSTLNTGTINVDGEAFATDDSITGTGFTATAKDGKFTAVGGLNAGESFIYGGTTYTQTALGLMSDGIIRTDLTGSAIDLSKLDSGEPLNLITLTDGELNLAGVEADSLVVDNIENPTTKLGTVKVTDNGYTVDFAVKVNAPAGETTLNGVTYYGVGELVLDCDGKTATLYDGTVSIDGTVKATNDSVTGEGITATAEEGKFIELSDLVAGVNFTYNGKNYKLIKDIGLYNSTNPALVTGGLEGTTLDLASLAETKVIAPTNGTINLANQTSAIVLDNVTNPTSRMGSLTVDGSNYTLDFAIEATLPSGISTVNGKTYNATTSLTLDVTADSSTLKEGTVELDVGDSVTTAEGKTISAISRGEIMSLAYGGMMSVTVKDGEVILGEISTKSTFDVDGTEYKLASAGLIKEGQLLTGEQTGDTVTLEQLNDADNWTTMLEATDGNIKVDDTTLADGQNVIIVDDINNPSAIYGTLSRTEDKYSLKAGETAPTSINVEGTVVEVANSMNSAPINTVNADGSETNFTVITPRSDTDHFTVNATGTVPVISEALAVEVSSGVLHSGDDDTAIDVAPDAEDVKITAGNGKHKVAGKTLTITGQSADVEIGLDDNGNISSIVGMDAGATVTIDGTTYTAPTSNATLSYTAADGWFFENYTPDSYTVTVDANGNVSVATGVKLSNVVSSGSALQNGTLTLAADVTQTPVTVINQGGAMSVVDRTGNTLASDVPRSTVTYNGDGISTSELPQGATINLSTGKKLTAGDITVTADAATTVKVGDGLELSAAATISDGTQTVKVSDVDYTVNMTNGKISGLSGVSAGATVSGLKNGTIGVAQAGSITVDKTFTADEPATYTVTNGKVSSVTNVGSLTGDFTNGVRVNGTRYVISGGTVNVDSDGTIVVTAGTYTINGKTYQTNVSASFTTADGTVTGVKLLDDGQLTVYQNEESLSVNDDTITLQGNGRATLTVAGDKVTAAQGITGTISGLDNATVADVSGATINGTEINISPAKSVQVEGGTTNKITGLTDGATITSAPLMTAITAENGTFTFTDDTFKVNDSVDGSVDFVTDSNSKVTDISNFAGELSGASSVNINGDGFSSDNLNVSVQSDGADITAVNGLTDGGSIGGDLSDALIRLPEGSVTINGASYDLRGDDEVTLQGDSITGLADGGVITFGTAGEYVINGQQITAGAGDAYTNNRDGLYRVDEAHQPISDRTPASEILKLSDNPTHISGTSGDVTLSGDNNLALLDGATAKVTTGEGNDSVIVRQGSQATVDVAQGSPLIVPTSGAVTLENYNDNTKIQTFDYTNIISPIVSGTIAFGDGVMTLGDAVVTFDDEANSTGATKAKLLNATGQEQAVGFTHTAGGTLNVSPTSENYLLMGDYFGNKTGNSTLTSGAGNDTLLIGAGDVANAGDGSNQIYVNDGEATIILSEGKNTVHGFNEGFTEASDKIQINDVSALEYGYTSAGLTLTSGNAELAFDNTPSKLKISDGRKTYKAQFAPNGSELAVTEAADIFYGNTNGINFSEYTGNVAVNLNDSKATMDGASAQLYGVDKVTAGAGNTTLIGADNVSNTLAAGDGNVTMRSGSGDDVMQGSEGKAGSAFFQYTTGDGLDTITNFDFMASADDTLSDEVYINTMTDTLTSIHLSGNDVVIGVNNSTVDFLTISDAKGKQMRFDGLIAKVDDNIAYDGFTDCYVGGAANSTLDVAEGLGDVDICLGEESGTQYIGDITVLNAVNANGSNVLIGNELNNLIVGGTGTNSIWGGDGTNDTLVGGSGANTFFFALENGNDIITSAHDGDVIDLTKLSVEQVASAEILDEGVMLELEDGSTLAVQSNAAVEYRLSDGTYTADHETKEWTAK